MWRSFKMRSQLSISIDKLIHVPLVYQLFSLSIYVSFLKSLLDSTKKSSNCIYLILDNYFITVCSPQCFARC